MENTIVPTSVLSELFPENNDLGEDIIIAFKCTKITKWINKSGLTLILSTHFIYLLKGATVTRKFDITELKYIIKGMMQPQVNLTFNQIDVWLTFNERDEFIDLLKLRFATLLKDDEKLFKEFSVPDNMMKMYKLVKN